MNVIIMVVVHWISVFIIYFCHKYHPYHRIWSDSPEPVSLEGRKMDDEPDERASSPSCLSLKSDRSMPEPVNFKCQETDLQQEWYGL